MTKRKSQEQFEKEILEKGNGDYVVKSPYLGSSKKVILLHIVCNNEWEVEANSFLNGRRCSHCFGMKKRTHEQFIKEVQEKHGNEYQILSKYINAVKKVEVKHLKCGNIYEMIANNIIKGSKCPFCFDQNNRLTNEEFLVRLQNRHEDEYVPIVEYIDCDKAIKFTHSKCGKDFEIAPKRILYGEFRCPNCTSMSRGETSVERFLIKNNLRYSYQFSINDCKNIKLLKFDFCVFDDENKIKCIIEYDGIQHFEPIETFGGIDNLKIVQYNDKLKNEYCERFNIKLIRIPYWVKNIGKFLEVDLSER